MTDIQAQASRIQDKIEELRETYRVPGYVALVYQDGAQIELASGVANLNTGMPMTPDTAFLLGSISKVLVTSLLMRYVDRGQIRLDDKVTSYLPDFRLSDPATLQEITVQNLLNHTNGIDADTFMPRLGRGADAISGYVALLAERDIIHSLGKYVSYSNPGFVVAGRVLEVVSGEDFDTILKRELFQPFGFQRSCTSGDEAILDRTAIGHLPDPATGDTRPTRRFMLEYSAAPAGATPITTVGDLLRFALVHLNQGKTPEGETVLSPDAVRAMATETFPSLAFNVNAIGLGWQLPRYGDTRMLSHSGGSFGGVSNLIVLPEHKVVMAAFGNSPAAAQVHAHLAQFLFDEILDIPSAPAVGRTVTSIDPQRYTGVYEHFQTRITVTEEDGRLYLRSEPHYIDDQHRALMEEYTGGAVSPAVALEPVTETLFMAKGQSLDDLSRLYGRPATMSFLDPGDDGTFQYFHAGMRISKRTG